MNKELLKDLYVQFCQNYHQVDEPWYNSYRGIVNRVKEWRDGHPSGPLDDKELLKSLYWENENGISSEGQSPKSRDSYQKLENDPHFLEACGNLIRNVTDDTIKEFEDAANAILDKKAYLRYHRFVAACSLDYSTTTGDNWFNRVFANLIQSKLLDPPNADVIGWYRRNRWLTQQLDFLCHEDGVECDEFWRNIFIWRILERYFCCSFQSKPQIVKYGPPGTGKTFLARREMETLFALWKVENNRSGAFDEHYLQLQFHPSFGYEDFLEGLRPVQNGEDHTELRLKNGKFKEFCRKAGRWEIDLATLGIYPDNDPEKSYVDLPVSELVSDANAEGKLLSSVDSERKERWEWVFDMVEKGETSSKLGEVLPPYFVLIDEINRAELSRTFGELMFCLEYRGVRGAVSTQYAELNTEKDAMLWMNNEAKFFVPTNVRIIGTMNTIDRSVESFDFALRRRFGWEFVGPNPGVLGSDLEKRMGWLGEGDRSSFVEGWKKLNDAIKTSPLLGPDYQIGHAYLMNLQYTKEEMDGKLEKLRQTVWNNSINPLLEEYLRGAYDKDSQLNPLKEFHNKFFCKS